MLCKKAKKSFWFLSGPTRTVKLIWGVQASHPIVHHKSPLDVSVSLNETGSACFPDLFLKHTRKELIYDL